MCPEAWCQAQTDSGKAAEWIERGNADLDRYFFTNAEADFRKAIALQPDSGPAHLLLARALLGELPANLKMFGDIQGILPKAEQAANTAVELSPANAEALCVAGIVNYKTALTLKDPAQRDQRMSQAQKTFERALAADPRSVEAHTELARMIVDPALEAATGARISSGMRIGQGGPIGNVELRHLLRTRYQAPLEDAMSHAKRALEIDPRYEPAMHQMAGLALLRASFLDNDSEYAADMQEANAWQQKEAALRAGKQPRTPPNLQGGVIGGIIGSMPVAPPPPKP
jgi:tetratricopeptide (TPR) repeat protein